MKKWKAAKYVRLSYTEDKSNESDSVINQKSLIDDFVKKQTDIEIISEKVDDGYSGIVYDRPAFKEMMTEITSGHINCVIVKDLSRLGREYIETGRYMKQIFPALGVRFIAINDGIDTIRETNSGDDLSISLKSLLNDEYCRDISKKTRSALTAKRKNGDYVGACPIYGYKKSEENKNILVVDEYPSGVVRDIFNMKLDGMSAAKIADELNEAGILSPNEYKKNKGLPHPTGGYADKDDSKWSATTVIRILKDETYTGTLIQGRQSTFNYKLRDLIQKPVAEWERTENTHEAIIRKHDFDLVQRIMNLNTRTSPNADKVYLFSGILICGSCGNRMTRKTVPYKDNKYYYYHCPSGKKQNCTTSVMIKENDLIECVLQSVKSHVRNVVSLEDLLDTINSSYINREYIRRHMIRLEENESRITQITNFKSSLYENFVNGILTKNEYKTHKESYDIEIGIIEKASNTLRKEIDNIQSGSSEQTKWTEHFTQFGNLNELTRKIVIRLIHSIKIIDKTTIQITFNYQLEYEKATAITSLTQKAVI